MGGYPRSRSLCRHPRSKPQHSFLVASCLNVSQKTTSPTCIFLCCRILFLATASSSSSLFQYLLGRTSISLSSRILEKGNHQDVVVIISKQLDFLLNGILLGTAMSREAMIDLLKFTFNLLCHWPKVSDSYFIIESSFCTFSFPREDFPGCRRCAYAERKRRELAFGIGA